MQGHSSCSINNFCIGAFLLFLGSILMVSLGLTVVFPHGETQDWPPATCVVTNASLQRNLCSCDGNKVARDEECTGRYPCLVITVTYWRQPPDTQHRRHNDTDSSHSTEMTGSYTTQGVTIPTTGSVTLPGRTVDTIARDTVTESSQQRRIYDVRNDTNVISDTTYQNSSVGTSRTSSIPGDEDIPTSTLNQVPTSAVYDVMETAPVAMATTPRADVTETPILTAAVLYRTWHDAFYRQCSLHECGQDDWNMRQAVHFRSHWGTPGQQVTCYYDPRNPEVVLLEKTSTSAMIHAILWPVVCLSSGASLWLCLCFGCCRPKDSEMYESYYTGI